MVAHAAVCHDPDLLSEPAEHLRIPCIPLELEQVAG
jgi:hypothetical protein